jgi:hypothetical protein
MKIKFLRDMVFAGKSYKVGTFAEVEESADLTLALGAKWAEVAPEETKSNNTKSLPSMPDGMGNTLSGSNDTF